jgi:hypothetical protein
MGKHRARVSCAIPKWNLPTFPVRVPSVRPTTASFQEKRPMDKAISAIDSARLALHTPASRAHPVGPHGSFGKAACPADRVRCAEGPTSITSQNRKVKIWVVCSGFAFSVSIDRLRFWARCFRTRRSTPAPFQRVPIRTCYTDLNRYSAPDGALQTAC